MDPVRAGRPAGGRGPLRRPVGIMLHHAVTDDGEFAALSALLALLTTHPGTRAISLTALAVVPS